MPKKILFINPPNPPEKISNKDMMGGFGQSYSGKAPTKIPALDLLYSATVCKKQGETVKVIDCLADDLNAQQLALKAKEFNPQLIAVRTSTPTIGFDLNVAEKIKHALPKAKIAFFGPHVSTFPEETIKHPAVDAIVIGEPDYAFASICKNGFGKTRGVWHKQKGKIGKTPAQPPIEALDDLPYPDWSLVPYEKYYLGEQVNNQQPFVTVLSSRGCPYGCIYCPYPVAQGLKWRSRSAKNVLGELEILVKKFKVKGILFRDAVFTLDKKRAAEIFEGIIERKLKFSFRCETRIDAVDEQLIELMAKAGCIGINFGIENGSESLLKKISRKTFSIEQAKKIVDACKKNKIAVFTFFIIGLPGETKQTAFQSVNLAKKLDPEYCQFTIASPYPGTKLHKWASEMGFIENQEWNMVNGYSATMRNEALTKKDMEKLHAYATYSLQMRPAQVLKRITTRGAIQIPKEAFKYLRLFQAWLVAKL